MKAKVSILNTKTGETRVYEEPDWCEYAWSEGNYSCDCNRNIYFDRVGGEERKDLSSYTCHTANNVFRVTRIVLEDGTKVPNPDSFND